MLHNYLDRMPKIIFSMVMKNSSLSRRLCLTPYDIPLSDTLYREVGYVYEGLFFKKGEKLKNIDLELLRTTKYSVFKEKQTN